MPHASTTVIPLSSWAWLQLSYNTISTFNLQSKNYFAQWKPVRKHCSQSFFKERFLGKGNVQSQFVRNVVILFCFCYPWRSGCRCNQPIRVLHLYAAPARSHPWHKHGAELVSALLSTSEKMWAVWFTNRNSRNHRFLQRQQPCTDCTLKWGWSTGPLVWNGDSKGKAVPCTCQHLCC